MSILLNLIATLMLATFYLPLAVLTLTEGSWIMTGIFMLFILWRIWS